jgi:hypothetical protein
MTIVGESFQMLNTSKEEKHFRQDVAFPNRFEKMTKAFRKRQRRKLGRRQLRVRIFGNPFVLRFKLQNPTRNVNANDVQAIIPLTEQLIRDQLRLMLGNRAREFDISIWRVLNAANNLFFWEITVSSLVGLFPRGDEPDILGCLDRRGIYGRE